MKYYRIKTQHGKREYVYFVRDTQECKNVIKQLREQLGHEVISIEEITEQAFKKLMITGGNVHVPTNTTTPDR